MNDRPAGSYIEEKDGTLTPNLDDEAMAAREAKKKETPAVVTHQEPEHVTEGETHVDK